MKKLLCATQPFPSRLADAAWLLFRLHLGLSIAIGAGWSKLVNLTTTQEAAKLATGAAPLGPPDWFVQQVASLGFNYPSPYMWAWLAAWGEFAGGLLVTVGLLTRWASLQLAVQFLIIAFVWYEAPEPVLGMYYQQLLFWAFVLAAVIGGGRYSLDYWWLRGSLAIRPLSWLAANAPPQAGIIVLGLLTGSVAAQPPVSPMRVTMPELQNIVQQWNGTLTYLDYKTHKRITLPTTLNGMQSEPRELVLDYVYQEPDGRQVKDYDKVQLAADGAGLIWGGLPMRLVRKTRLPEELELVLEGRGLDDNKACLIKKTIRLGSTRLTILKEVKYDTDQGFIVRNEYALHHASK